MAKCIICGISFDPKIDFPLTCGSQKCRYERRKQRGKALYRLNRLEKKGIDVTKGYCQICYKKIKNDKTICSKQCMWEYQYQEEINKRKTRPFSYDTDLLIVGELLKGTSRDKTARILADILNRDYGHLRKHIDDVIRDGTYKELTKIIKENRKNFPIKKEVII